jgi:hypothetical protein
MLASMLRSPGAVVVNIDNMRVLVCLRHTFVAQAEMARRMAEVEEEINMQVMHAQNENNFRWCLRRCGN